MKLSDLQRFSVEVQPHATGGMEATLFVLGGTKIDSGSQRQLDMFSFVSKGKSEEDATANATDLCLEVLENTKDIADIVKVGVRELIEVDGVFKAKVQVGLFDKESEGADLIRKKGFGFGEAKDIKEAQKNAVESALRLMGER